MSAEATSQIVVEPESERVGSAHSLFPLLGYASDYGLYGGAVYQRINYGEGRRPFLSKTLIDIVGSTRGRWSVHLDYESIEFFGYQIRNQSIAEFELNPNRTFFGIGNDTGFSSDRFEDGIYYLNQRHGLLTVQLRRTIAAIADGNNLEGVFRLQGSYTTTSDRGSDTIFFMRSPNNAQSGWVNKVGVGLIYDTRESEFDPRSGLRSEIGADVSTSLLGSNFTYYEAFADVRGFVSLIRNIVLAQRIEGRHNSGGAPFWELPALGSKDGLRGFALDRFMGNSSVVSMSEARAWLFSFFDGDLRIGGHAFYDTGRVFSDEDSNRFFGEWKNTWGGGGAVTLFNPDLIMRGEVGFSEEDYRIYVGLGYSF